MRLFFIIVSLASIVLGCQSHTEYGKCIGIDEKGEKHLEYKLSSRNIVIAIIFFELVIPPVLVVTDELYCPTGIKE